MRCRVCGELLQELVTDLPFETGDTIVVLKALPVLQCARCGDTELAHQTMDRVEQLLAVNRDFSDAL